MSAQHELAVPPADVISSVRFSPDGSQIAVGSWDSHIYTYQRTDEGANPFALSHKVECDGPVLDVAWNSDGTGLFYVGLDQDLSFRSLDGNEDDDDPTTLSTHEEPSNKVAYSREHGIVLSTSWDGTMHVHDPESGAFIRVRLAAKPFALSLSSNHAVVAMAERKVSVYQLHDLKQLIEQTGNSSDLQPILEVQPWQPRESSLKFMTRAVSCMPDGTGFATSSIEGRVGVEWFDPDLQSKTYAFKCHRQASKTVDEDGQERDVDIVYPVNALAFHPVYGTFATGGGDGVVALWDAQTKRRVRQYPKLGASVAALDFSSNGRYMAIGVSPGFEDGMEDEGENTNQDLIKVIVRELGENEAKGKAAK